MAKYKFRAAFVFAALLLSGDGAFASEYIGTLSSSMEQTEAANQNQPTQTVFTVSGPPAPAGIGVATVPLAVKITLVGLLIMEILALLLVNRFKKRQRLP